MELDRWLAIVLLATGGLAFPATGQNRQIGFTTSEGTWMSLDVSPDGRTIVFDLLGDLYTLPLTGGRATRITSGRGFDAMPRWSHDGQWIAFASDREGGSDLWRVRADGSDLRLIAKQVEGAFTSPTWSADGQSIIVALATIRPSPEKVRIFPLDGGPARKLVDSATRETSATGLTTTPDGRYLYYRSGNQIVRFDFQTGQQSTVTNPRSGASRAAVSRDGKLMAYTTRFDGQTGLRLRDLGTGKERWLKYPVDRDYADISMSSRDIYPGFAFTPDGQALVIAIGNRIRRIEVATGNLTTIEMTADVDLELGPRLVFQHPIDTGAVRARYIQQPSFSPDGKRLAFGAFGRLYLQEFPKGTPRLLLPDSIQASGPAWSPDGQWIAFTTSDREGATVVWKVAVGGGTPIRLTHDDTGRKYDVDLTWSPDGTEILAGNVSIPANGGSTRDNKAGRMPHFTKAGDRIYFTGGGLQSVSLEGDSVKTLLNVTAPAGRNFGGFPTGFLVSPDGQYALTRVRNELYLVRLPEPTDTSKGYVHLNAPRLPTKRVAAAGCDFFGWTDDGATIYWSVGATIFRVPFAQIEFPPLPAKPFIDRGQWDSVNSIHRPVDPSRPISPIATEIVVERPRDVPAGEMLIRNGRIIPIDGPVIERGDLLIRGDRIVALGPAGSIPLGANTRVLDATGKTIIPGFVDLHPHWEGLTQSSTDPNPWSLEAALAYGVTTGRVPAGGGGDPGIYRFADRQAIGDLVGPRIFAAEPNLGSDIDVYSPNDADSLVSKFRRYYRTDFLKQYLAGPRLTRRLVAEAAAKYRVTATTEGGFDLALHLTNIIDGYATEHTYPATPIGDDIVQLVVRAGNAYDPTLTVNQMTQGFITAQDHFYWTTAVHNDPKLRRFVPHSRLDNEIASRRWNEPSFDPTPGFAADVARIARAGGRVVVGSHSEMEGLSFHWEMWSYARGGMTPTEILTAATLNGAKAMGYDRDLGSLTPGKLADLVILDANPLDDIRHTGAIRWVIRGGTLYDGATLDRLWPTPASRPTPWWFADDPTVK